MTEKSLTGCMAAAAKLLFGLALTWVTIPQPVRAQNGLLVSSFQTSEVRLYSPPPPATPTQSSFVTQGLGGLSTPTGLTFDPQGNLYVGNSGFSGAVFEYDKTGAFVRILVPYGADGQGLLVYPEALTFGPDGLLYVANNRSAASTNQGCLGDVLRFDGKTGAFVDEFVKCTNNGGLGDPLDLTFGPDGNLYVSSPFVLGKPAPNGAVIRYDGRTGEFKDYFVQPGSGGLLSPWGIVFGPDFKLYVADDGGNSVLRYDGVTGAFIDQFVPPASGQLLGPTGLTFGPDMNLYVGSGIGNSSAVKRYDRTTGAYIDDYVSSASGLSFPTFLAFPPSLSCPQSVRDSDGDGIPDCWELNGVDVNGSHINFPGANPYHKDIFVEIDWMPGWQPSQTALNEVVTSFANAPVQNLDGTTGIAVHFELDEQINNTPQYPLQQSITFESGCGVPAISGTPDFADLENQYFGTAAERSDPNAAGILKVKRAVYHYAIFAYGLGSTTASGCAALPGRDLTVTLGIWGSGNTPDNQAASLMHELGHNLNLWHGGFLDDPANLLTYNCKPNYLSVMNYSFEFNGAFVNSRPLDYSRSALAALNKASLNDPSGIGGSPGDHTYYTCPDHTTQKFNVDGSKPIDWACDGSVTETGVDNPAINFVFYYDSHNVQQVLCHEDGGLTGVLQGFNDWANIKLDFGGLSAFGAGASVGIGTPDVEMPFEAVYRNRPALTITANSLTQTYGSAIPALTATYAGFVNGDTPASLTGTLLCTTTATSASPVGSYPISCSGQTSLNYTITYDPGTLTITPTPLTVTANSFTRPYGANNPTLTGTFAGLLNGDSFSAIYATTATPASPPGNYPIVPAVAQSTTAIQDYAITIVNGTLTVLPEPTMLTVSLSPTSIPVGQTSIATITLTAPDLVIPIDPTVLPPVTLSSTFASDILSSNGMCTFAATATPNVVSCTITITAVEPNNHGLLASFPRTTNFLASTTAADLLVTAALQSQNGCISSDFRNVAVPGGSYIWFNSIFRVRDVSQQQKITISFFQSSVQFQYTDPAGNLVNVNQHMPDAKIVIDPSVTMASTTFDSANSVWITTIPFDLDDNAFLTGLPWPVPSAGLPADVEPVTWCGTFASDTADIDIGWRWAAAAYSSFSGDSTVLGVKPMDTDNDNAATNHDRVGTPENFKTFVIPGARGKGGKNYTGSYSRSSIIE